MPLSAVDATRLDTQSSQDSLGFTVGKFPTVSGLSGWRLYGHPLTVLICGCPHQKQANAAQPEVRGQLNTPMWAYHEDHKLTARMPICEWRSTAASLCANNETVNSNSEFLLHQTIRKWALSHNFISHSFFWLEPCCSRFVTFSQC